jgi:hypothetical protein
MSTLLAMCLVTVAAAEVAIAIVAIRALYRFNRAATELEQSARAFGDCASQAQAASREVQEFVASLRDVVPPVRRAAESFGRVGERAADLGSAVLSEVEGPVRRTMDLFRGVQAGANYFLDRLVHHEHATRNGGTSDE